MNGDGEYGQGINLINVFNLYQLKGKNIWGQVTGGSFHVVYYLKKKILITLVLFSIYPLAGAIRDIWRQPGYTLDG